MHRLRAVPFLWAAVAVEKCERLKLGDDDTVRTPSLEIMQDLVFLQSASEYMRRTY